MGSIPGWGRSPGGGSGNPLQYSCLENPKDRGVWWAMVHGFAESNTPERLTHTHTQLLDNSALVSALQPRESAVSTALLTQMTLYTLKYWGNLNSIWLQVLKICRSTGGKTGSWVAMESCLEVCKNIMDGGNVHGH